MDGIKRLLCFAGCALIWIPTFGYAADTESRTYAVLSLIGDKIYIVAHESTTGSKTDRNRQGSIAVDDRALDNRAVLAASNAIKLLDAHAATVSLTSSNATLYELQNELFEPQDRSVALLAALRELVQSQDGTHLVLITKHRGDALLRLEKQYTGSGKIEGVGFYLDADLRTKRTDTSASGQGFLAPFAYIKVTLVDAKTMGVIRERTAEETTTLSTARADGGSLNPADVLTPAQKTAALQRMIDTAIARVMPDVLGIESRGKAVGQDHSDVEQSLNSLAEQYRAQGRFAEAEPLVRRLLEIREKALGPNHPEVAKSLNNLAELYQRQGRFAEASGTSVRRT